MGVLEELAASDATALHQMPPEEARAFANAFSESELPTIPIAHVENLEIPRGTSSISARLYHPAPGTTLPLVVGFHGGGWMLGNLDTYDAEAREIATYTQSAVLSIDYRLAPENPFPAAVEDALVAMEWAGLHAAKLGCDPNRLGLTGSSAGGNLAAVCALVARDQGSPAIRHQMLVYPVLDADFDRPTMHAFAEGLLLERDAMIWFWKHYCPEESERTHFRASPIRANSFVGLPPTYLALAAMDPLLDEGLDYGVKLQEAGVRTEIRVAPRMIHGFFAMSSISEAAHSEVKRACNAMRLALHAEI
jgi:acetyl esterase